MPSTGSILSAASSWTQRAGQQGYDGSILQPAVAFTDSLGGPLTLISGPLGDWSEAGRLDSDPSDRLMSARTHSGYLIAGVPADIAQLVERNLAKVEVAGSSPVVRSKAPMPSSRPPTAWARAWNLRWSGREARQRPAKPSTRVQIPSPPRAPHERAIGAAVARFPDTEEVTGSIPVSPTSSKNGSDLRKRGSEPFCIEPCTDLIFGPMVPLLD